MKSVEKSWALDVGEVLKRLGTSELGLTSQEAEKRLSEFGPNEIQEEERLSALGIFLAQFKGLFIYLLFVAAILSLILGAFLDAVVIIAILILNAILGFIQEYKANRALQALKALASPRAIVVRDGKTKEIDARELVPGDVVILKQGMIVPADVRIISTVSMKISYASLTGESVPISVTTERLPEETSLPDRTNMAFMGCIVEYGKGKGVVTATGTETEMGKIAKKVKREKETPTHLQMELDKLSIWLTKVILALIISVSLLYMFEENLNIFDALFVAIALAVSAVPEGLPAVVTITLSIGASVMVRANALVRKLASIETLGSVNVICTDKTGTLTKNEMTVKEIWLEDGVYKVTGSGYDTKGKVLKNGRGVSIKTNKALKQLGLACVLCNNAELIEEGRKIIGDPTEGALLVFGKKLELEKRKLEKEYPEVAEISFSSERKRMTTINQVNGKLVAFVKGAPEVILKRCSRIMRDGKIVKMSRDEQRLVENVYNDMTGRALRVLAVAFKELKSEKAAHMQDEKIENDLVFLGLVGMIDPPRPEAKEFVSMAKEAGIRVIMVTGDHKNTAIAVAKEVGIFEEEKLVLESKELAKISNKKLKQIVDNICIVARASPDDKIRITEVLQERGYLVAMTGDGVNDAPALKKANVGVAMGIKGTDVAKEVSDIILLDDNFATIVKAIKIGRGIYENIKRFVVYLLACNFDEIALIGTTSLMKLPLPMIPVQILWLNLLTDSGPAIALGMDKPPRDIMKRAPRDPKEGMISKSLPFILIISLAQYIATLFVFLYHIFTTGNVVLSRTATFTADVVFELVIAFIVRFENRSLFHEMFSNKGLWVAVFVGFLLQLFVVYLPPLQKAFGTTALGISDWLMITTPPLLAATGIEIWKYVRGRFM